MYHTWNQINPRQHQINPTRLTIYHTWSQINPSISQIKDCLLQIMLIYLSIRLNCKIILQNHLRKKVVNTSICNNKITNLSYPLLSYPLFACLLFASSPIIRPSQRSPHKWQNFILDKNKSTTKGILLLVCHTKWYQSACNEKFWKRI